MGMPDLTGGAWELAGSHKDGEEAAPKGHDEL